MFLNTQKRIPFFLALVLPTDLKVNDIPPLFFYTYQNSGEKERQSTRRRMKKDLRKTKLL